jgi:hypothetical protein
MTIHIPYFNDKEKCTQLNDKECEQQHLTGTGLNWGAKSTVSSIVFLMF